MTSSTNTGCSSTRWCSALENGSSAPARHRWRSNRWSLSRPPGAPRTTGWSAVANRSTDRWGVRSARLLFRLLRDEVRNHLIEQRQRQVAVLDDGIVKRSQVEAGSQARARLIAQFVDFRVPDLVPARLARPGAVAVDLILHLGDRRAVGRCEPLDRL